MTQLEPVAVAPYVDRGAGGSLRLLFSIRALPWMLHVLHHSKVGSDDTLLSQMIGEDYLQGHLIAAELSCVPPRDSLLERRNRFEEYAGGGVRAGGKMITSVEGDGGDGTEGYCCELLLCCLTSTGYITTHAVPEATALHYQIESPLATKTAGDRVHHPSSPFRYRVGTKFNSDHAVKIYKNSTDGSVATNDLSRHSSSGHELDFTEFL